LDPNLFSRRFRRRIASAAFGLALVCLTLVAWAAPFPGGKAILVAREGPVGTTAGDSAGAGPTASLQPFAPVATVYPRDTRFPTRDFHVIPASSCDPGLVPGAMVPAPAAASRVANLSLRVPILMYHRVVPSGAAGEPRAGLAVPPGQFDAQLGALAAAGWHTITLADLAGYLEAGIRPPARTFVITIDDGWADGYEYALPILRSHGFVATFFVIAGRIGQPAHLTADQVWALHAAGNEIGNHTVDHVRLVRLSSAQIAQEVASGAATIASITGSWPETLAYPFGRTNDRVEAVVRACGPIRMAVAERNLTGESWATRLRTPRYEVTSGTKPAALLAYVRGL
jgi:peptidoglycan/xylan/chitin deacetylase (PgdA/CDA1 family)